jgi:predicted amidohydrolase YtcJ
MDAVKADLVGVKNVDDIVARLKAYAPNPEAGEWIIAQGWDEGYFGSVGYPDRAKIDAAFPDNPIKMESLHGFGGFYNGAALRIAGIDKDTPEPKVGNILRRENGEPTGVMLTLAQGLINKHVPPISAEDRKKAIRAGLLKMGQAGVTSIHEAGMTPEDVSAFQALADASELPIRVYGMLDGNNESLMQEWFARGYQDDPHDMFDVRGIKVFYDGSLGSRTALMAEPYSDHPEKARPTERISPVAMLSLGERAAKTGFQMAVHAIGDEGNNRTLNIFEEALETAPPHNHSRKNHRWRIEHAQVVLPDFYDRMAALGALASVESSHAVGDSGWAEDRVGPDRIKHAYAWQNMLDAKVRVLMNSDLPGEPWEPMQTLYFAVTRKKLDGSSADDGTPDDGWYMDQAMSVSEALHAMTLENAYGAFQEDSLGSLTVGKHADFIVLSDDPYSVAPDALKDIKVTATYLGGQPLPESLPQK